MRLCELWAITHRPITLGWLVFLGVSEELQDDAGPDDHVKFTRLFSPDDLTFCTGMLSVRVAPAASWVVVLMIIHYSPSGSLGTLPFHGRSGSTGTSRFAFNVLLE